jgi:hypothetical protein
MKNYILFTLSACLIVVFSLLQMEKAFSQNSGRADNQDSISGVTARPDGTSSYVTGITSGRAKSLIGSGAGLVSLVIGWRSKLRSNKGMLNSRTGPIMALLLGLISIVLSVIHLSNSYGAAFGSGSGKAGAIVGLLLGLIGMTLSGLALRRKQNKI